MASEKKGDGGTSRSANVDRFKLEAKRASGPFLLFILVCVAGLFTAAGIAKNLAGNKPWIDYAPEKVAFADAKGVIPQRAELRLAGVKAGTIKASKLVNGQAVLTLNLEKKYAPMYKNARVRIRPITPLEDMYVDILTRGTPSAGKLGKNDILPTSQTQSPTQIGNVLDTFNKGTRANIGSILNQFSRGLDGNGGQDLKWSFRELTPFFLNATKVLDALAARRDNFKRFVTNFGQLTGELGNTDRQLANFVTNGDAVLGELAQDDQPFSDTLSQLPPTLRTMRSSFANLRRTQDVLDPTLRSLRPVAAKLPSGLKALNSFALDATPALNTLRTPVKALRPLATSLRPTSRSLVGVFDKLNNSQAPQLDTGLQKTTKCLAQTGQFISRIMSATKLGDAVGQPDSTSDANFRADASVDFETVGEQVADPNWLRFVPCEYEGQIKNPAAAGLSEIDSANNVVLNKVLVSKKGN